MPFARRLPLLLLLAFGWLLFALSGCESPPAPPKKPANARPPLRPNVAAADAPKPGNGIQNGVTPSSSVPAVMLGIDVLEAQNFAQLSGKRVGLLTHQAGTNRFGVPTVEILRRAAGVKLVALFGVEHGIHGAVPAGQNYQDHRDPKTGLPVLSLYNGKSRKPTKAQLQGIDVLVLDLQDIGSRSYTYISAMRLAMEACFEQGLEFVVLDRPNPLGGYKVSGPMMDDALRSYVGAFPVPYVHGLTMGELARFAASTPGVLDVPDGVRRQGKLTVVPMRGWRRAMRWPETGLTFVPTSPYVRDFAACVGYAMTGLGCEIGGFSHGIGTQHPFRGLFFEGKTGDALIRELEALRLPGVAYHRIAVTNKKGEPATGVLVAVTDWDDWRPTDLSFHLMRLACRFNGRNVFATAEAPAVSMFNKLVGSQEFWTALKRDGAKVDIERFLREWKAKNTAYQQQIRRVWLYD